MALRITPDSELVTIEAIKNRIAQLEEKLKGTQDPVDLRQINGRLRSLQTRLDVGSPDKTAANQRLLLSKKDLE